MKPTTLPTTMLALAALAMAVLAPTAAAQVGTFGSVSVMGDADYIPLLKSDSKGLGDISQVDPDLNDDGVADASGTEFSTAKVRRANLGDDDEWKDDCIVVDTGTSIGTEPDPIFDLRLSFCGPDGEKAPGTTIGETEETVDEDTYVEQDADCIRIRLVQTVKEQSPAKFDKGETLYLVYYALDGDGDGTYCEAADGDPDAQPFKIPANEVSTGVDGNWAIRLTPYKDYPAGSWVRVTDEDNQWHREDAADQTVKFSFVDREDKTWYLVPSLSDFTKVAKGTALPAKSVRLGITGVAGLQPLVQVSSLDLPEDDPVAGEDYKVTVRYSNDGKAPGNGLLVTRLDGAIVDARLTPILDVNQPGSAIVAVPMPHFGGSVLLEVSGFKVTLDVEGPAAPDAGAGEAEADALAARIDALEAELEALRAAPPVASGEQASEGIPGVAPLLLAAVALGVAALRRRA